MEYLWVKLIHILSSTILFGTGLGTACVMLFGYKTGDTKIISAVLNYVVLADWIFTVSSGILQPLTGFWMVYSANYSLTSLWIAGSIIGYGIAALCWFCVAYLQVKMRDLAMHALTQKEPLGAQFYRYFKYWFCLGWPAFISLIIVFYLMTNKPV